LALNHHPKVVLSNWVHPEVKDLLGQACTVVPNDTDQALAPAELQHRCRDAHGLMAFMSERIDNTFLASCPDLRVIACALKGHDNFEVDDCTSFGVWLTVVPDLLTMPTAELAIGLMIAIGRNILAGDRLVRGGNFAGWRPILYGQGIDDSTVGLVGAGAVGKAIAQRLGGFRTRLLYTDNTPLSPSREDELRLHRVALGELLEQSDFVVLCLPLLRETRHLVDRNFLARMKPSGVLVNTARGSLVDEGAVADALEGDRLAGYAADVFSMEDWALPNRPRKISARLLRSRKVVLTPHLGSAVDRVRREIALRAAESILQALRGEIPAGAVNRPSSPRPPVLP
jgi:phosphonate dehydrogenase